MKIAHEKWHIVDPVNARTSCVFHSLSTCRNWKSNPILLQGTEEANTKRAISARDLKTGVNNMLALEDSPIIKEGGDDDAIQSICNYVNTPTTLYNNLFGKIKQFNPTEYNYMKLKSKKGEPVVYSKTQKYFKKIGRAHV